jgi:hypothetical protein
MAYQPYHYATLTTADKAVQYDPKRTVVTITNLSAITVYLGVDSTLTTTNGIPIFSNGRFEASHQTGYDPTIAYWLVDGSGGGDIRISESSDVDPYLEIQKGMWETMKNICNNLKDKR